jgi:two-component system, NarL family, invasion response regulator UvrY
MAFASPSPHRTDVTVLVVDDHAIFLDVSRQVIDATPGFEAVGEATSGEEGIALAAALRPDLVLMDVRMPGVGGPEAARRIMDAGSAGAVVLVSSDPQGVGGQPVMSKRQLRPSTLVALWEARAGTA